MSDISERLVVHCPDREASGHLAAFIAEHAVGDGTIRVALRLSASLFSDRRSLLERQIVATMYPLRSINDPHPTYCVSWSPKNATGPLPQFVGALALERSVTDDCFGLIISGHYEPPFGVVGSLVDAALGSRIVHASARDLLHTIAGYVEYASARNEAARARQYRSPLRRDAALH